MVEDFAKCRDNASKWVILLRDSNSDWQGDSNAWIFISSPIGDDALWTLQTHLRMLHLIHSTAFLGQPLSVAFSNFQQMKDLDVYTGKGVKT